MLYVTQTIERAALEYLHENRPDGYRGSVIDVDGMTIATGGLRNYDPARIGEGITKAYAEAFRKHLRDAAGITLSQDATDALLSEALRRGTMSPMVDIEKRRARERRKKANRRAKARAAGLCIICCKNVASYSPKDGSQNATCLECQKKANEAKKGAP